MPIADECQLVRIYIGEHERHEGRPLYDAIINLAKESGLAGCTILRGIEGYGYAGRIHKERPFLSDDLPIVIEIVDKPERLGKVLPTIDKMVKRGLITSEQVSVLAYRHESK